MARERGSSSAVVGTNAVVEIARTGRDDRTTRTALLRRRAAARRAELRSLHASLLRRARCRPSAGPSRRRAHSQSGQLFGNRDPVRGPGIRGAAGARPRGRPGRSGTCAWPSGPSDAVPPPGSPPRSTSARGRTDDRSRRPPGTPGSAAREATPSNRPPPTETCADAATRRPWPKLRHRSPSRAPSQRRPRSSSCASPSVREGGDLHRPRSPIQFRHVRHGADAQVSRTDATVDPTVKIQRVRAALYTRSSVSAASPSARSASRIEPRAGCSTAWSSSWASSGDPYATNNRESAKFTCHTPASWPE
jgi:hypothetical protein